MPKSHIILYDLQKRHLETPAASRNASSGIGCAESRAEIA